MILKPQDILILLKITARQSSEWSYAFIAGELFMSASEVHAGLKRASAARLFHSENRTIFKKALIEFLIHGVKYAYPPVRAGRTRGIPTAYAAPPLCDLITQTDDNPPVWPFPKGKVSGYEFSPLYRSVPYAALKDKRLYELLVLVDAIRDGRARERGLAESELSRRIIEK